MIEVRSGSGEVLGKCSLPDNTRAITICDTERGIDYMFRAQQVMDEGGQLTDKWAIFTSSVNLAKLLPGFKVSK